MLDSRRWPTLVLIAATSGVVSAAVVAAALSRWVPDAVPAAEPLAERMAVIEARLQAIEAELARTRPEERPSAPSGLPRAAIPAGGAGRMAAPARDPLSPSATAIDGAEPSPETRAATERVLEELLEKPGEEVIAAVEATLVLVERRRAEAALEARQQRDRASFLGLVGSHLEATRDRLGLSDAQVEALRSLAEETVDKRQEAEREGADPAALAAIDREGHARIRRVLGEQAYRKFHEIDIEQRAHAAAAIVAAAAGVDEDQRRRIDALIADHVGSVVDDQVRVSSEEMPEGERRAAEARIRAAQAAAWQVLVEDILTGEQRHRLPPPFQK